MSDSAPKLKVLVVEDNPESLDLLLYLLGAFGYDTCAARDGETALRTAAELSPDLIICDIHLPGMDGFGVVKHLKADAHLCRTPVVAVTALAMVGDRERLLAAGFDGYIGKPIEPDTFVTQIESFLPGAASAPASAAH